MVVLLLLQSGGDGFIENLRPKIDVDVVIETVRLVKTVNVDCKLQKNVDCKLQKSLRRLPCFHMLRLWRHTDVVTVVVVDHELVEGDVISRVVAFFKSAET